MNRFCALQRAAEYFIAFHRTMCLTDFNAPGISDALRGSYAAFGLLELSELVPAEMKP
jgi:hypothetical protein